MKALGIDIGTTTVCAIVLDTETGDVLKAVTEDNGTFRDDCEKFEKIQSPDKILEKAMKLVNDLKEEFSPISCIGVTGQMHGIVYLDENADAVSGLYIWQDGSGNQIKENGKTYAAYLSELTGYSMSTGFGGTTYYYHSQNGKVPANAKTFCTIHDYVALKLAGINKPIMHSSDAASYGLYDIKNGCFDKEAIEKAGLDFDMFPEVTTENKIIGKFEDEIPVSVAIGDNQASFIGSVCDVDDCLLVNVGTGSQMSFATKSVTAPEGLEIRPCIDDSMIIVGSSLCGGRAFALLENFLRETAELVTGEKVKSAYPGMDKYLDENEDDGSSVEISTLFSGSRKNPDDKASITNIGIDNFTPGSFIYGMLNGMAHELKEMYDSATAVVSERPKQLIGSGNGIRKTAALRKIFSDMFGAELKVPVHKEEAAFGAALFSLTSAHFYDTIKETQMLIKYKTL